MKHLITALLIVLSLAIFTAAQDDEGFVGPVASEIPAPTDYPDIAIAAGFGGTIVVNVKIDKDGDVVGIESVSGPDSVCQSVTHPAIAALRDVSVEAAKRAKFSPATKDGKPVESSIGINYKFGDLPADWPFGSSGTVKQYAAAPRSENRAKVATTKDDDKPANPADVERPVKAPKGDDQDVYTIIRDPAPRQDAIIEAGPSNSTRSTKHISGGVVNGKAIMLPKPPYPPAARAIRASGAVSVQVMIDVNGEVFASRAVSGHPLLRATSVNAACGAKFSPIQLEGQPVKVSGIITYNFVP